MKKPALMLLSIALRLLLLDVSPAKAEKIRICENVLREVLMPPTVETITQCSMGLRCFLLPHCCVPGLCNSDPLCLVTKQIEKAAYSTTRTELECSIKDINPREILHQWLMRHTAMLDDAVLPFVKDIIRADLAVAYDQATPLTPRLKEAIRLAVGTDFATGAAKFDSADIDRVRVISAANPLVSTYLRPGYDAITLGDVVVVRPSYMEVMSNYESVAANAIVDGSAPCNYANTVALLAHELTHVRQYRETGFDGFTNTYLLHAFSLGYNDIPFEKEAYAYGSLVHARMKCGRGDVSKPATTVSRKLPKNRPCRDGEPGPCIKLPAYKETRL